MRPYARPRRATALASRIHPAPLHTLDANLVITDVSNSWLSFLGYARKEVVGRPINDFYAPQATGWSEAALSRLRADRGAPIKDGASFSKTAP